MTNPDGGSSFGTGLRQVWSVVGAYVRADFPSRRALIELKGVTVEASERVCEGAVAKLQDWLVFNSVRVVGRQEGFHGHCATGLRALATYLGVAAGCDGQTYPTASDMRRKELAIAQLNPSSAFELADMIAGGPVADSEMGKASKRASREVGYEDMEAMRGGPGSKMAKIAERAESLGQIE